MPQLKITHAATKNWHSQKKKEGKKKKEGFEEDRTGS